MDGGACLYTVIQWKTAASVLQSGNWANRTVIYLRIIVWMMCDIRMYIQYREWDLTIHSMTTGFGTLYEIRDDSRSTLMEI